MPGLVPGIHVFAQSTVSRGWPVKPGHDEGEIMKLASLKHGRDGRLVVVSRDLTRCADAFTVAPTLQAALDDWAAAEPRLTEIADALEAGRISNVPFDQAKCAAPLPRSHGWADGSAYVNHVALVRRARGAELPASFWTDPLMYRGGSDAFLGPRDLVAGDTCGVIVGSGTVSNRDADGGPGKPIGEGGVGYSCIAELRSVETIVHGAPKTPFLKHGDRIRVEMNDAHGGSIFGAIEQDVVPYAL